MDRVLVTVPIDIVTNNVEYNQYVHDANVYWSDNLYWYKSRCEVLRYFDGDDEGYVFGRLNDDAYDLTPTFHISRFSVKNERTGFGSKIIKHLQSEYKHMTLWSNESSLSFYKKNGFVFTYLTNNVDGDIYTFGEWDS